MNTYEVTITRTGSIIVSVDTEEEALQKVNTMSNKELDCLGNLTNWEPSDAEKISIVNTNKNLIVNGTLFLRVVDESLCYDDIFEIEKAIRSAVALTPTFVIGSKTFTPTIVGCLENGGEKNTVFSINLFGEINSSQETEWIKFWTDFPKQFVESFSGFELATKFKYVATAPMSIDVV